MPEAKKKRYHFPDSDPVISKGAAKYYHFRWPDYSSWAIFTVCDATGEFHIQSDWGNFSFRWDTRSLGGGQSLTEFLASCSGEDYVMRKLRYDRPDLKDVVDEDATKAKWQQELHERMDGVTFDISDKEIIEEQMQKFFDEVYNGDANIALWTMETELHEFFHQEPWEHLVCGAPGRVDVCQDELLPRFFQYLRDHVVQPKEARSSA